MNYLGKVIDNVRYAYKEINAATLTGAIDVIVVEQPDGSYTCSPFHVRFGKIGVLRSREKIVEIEINGEPCDIYMKLGESGEAFFVEELSEEDRSLPEHLVCSPILYHENIEHEAKSAVWNTLSNNKDSEESASELVEDTVDHPTAAIKTFHAKTVQSLSNCEIAVASEFRPIQSQPEQRCYQGPIEKVVSKLTTSDNNLVAANKTNGKKKRRRRKKTQLNENKTDNNKEVVDEDESIPATEKCPLNDDLTESSDLQKTDFDGRNSSIDQCNLMTTSVTSDLHFFSDTDVPCGNYDDNQQFSPAQSDTEFEVSTRSKSCEEIDVDSGDTGKNILAHRPSWRWGELPSPILKSEMDKLSCPKETSNERNPEVQRSVLASMLGFMKKTKHIRNNELDGSIYLSQIDAEELNPEIARLYLSQCHCVDKFKIKDEIERNMGNDEDDDVDEGEESGNGPSLAQSPVSDVETSTTRPIRTDEPAFLCDKDDWDISMSLCGGLNDSHPTDEQFNEHLISYEQFINDPAIFKNPNLIFRINGQMYQWDIACPLILSVALFKKPLPQDILNGLEEDGSVKTGKNSNVESNRHRRGYYSWFYWARTTQNKSVSDSIVTGDVKDAAGVQVDVKITPICQMGNAVSTSSILSSSDTFVDVTPNRPTTNANFLSFPEEHVDTKRIRTYSSTDSEFDTSTNNLLKIEKNEMYRKTLRLTSEQIGSLNLKRGANEVMFSVTTAYQGTTTCTCTLFLWRHDDKIVISDIDGTITKSDVLGHIMPIVGNVWAQNGVAKLFNRIEDNGYKLLYLSARAIGQSKGTRKYLNSIIQDDLSLPDGPLLLNPTSLLSAFHREVIEKKPEEFKISCLRDIQALFPKGSNPFYAGYGNKINDVWTYQAVGVPMFRIFTINHRGVLRHELSNTFQSSYLSMSQIADQLFPVRSKQTIAEEFSEFNYWRDPIENINDSQ